MTAKYVNNWYSIIALYVNILSKTTARFKNGKKIVVSNDNYIPFREEVYRQYLQDNGFTYRTGEATTIETNNGLHLVLLPNSSNTIEEIFVRNTYKIPSITGRTAIDIGASVGDSALYFVSRGASQVYGFEIDEERYLLAVKNIVLNSLSDKIQIYKSKATSQTLKDLILQFGLKDIFLKLDCEGCEYEIIDNTESRIYERITDIVMEYHGHPAPLVRRLKTVGFTTRHERNVLARAKEGMIYAKKCS